MLRIRNKKRLFAIIGIGLVCLVILILYRFNYIPHQKFTSKQLGYEPYISSHDEDEDGFDDQTDILTSALKYIETKPKYKSKYYTTGYSNDEYGVCTDVVASALQGAGYDLMTLVQEDIAAHPNDYDISEPDPNIDFRRVRNLKVYFQHTAIPLTLDISQTQEWQGGDIVIFERHIGIISDNRNRKGIPFVIHNANPIQASYEEDILETWGEIVGHYRIN